MSEFATGHDGVKLRCQSFGKGRPVVLAHGYLLDRTMYEPLARALAAAGYRAITFDQRAHGQSHGGDPHFDSNALALDYRAVLEHFDAEDATLVGHSMGAFIALLFCLKEPASAQRRLRRLVLLGGNAGAVTRGSLLNRLQTPLLASGLIQPIWRSKTGSNLFLRQLFGPHPDPAQIEATRAVLLQQNVRSTLPMLRAMAREDHYHALGTIPFETRVLCGAYDRTCPSWHSKRLAASIPNARVRWLARAGHMLPLEAPDAVFDSVHDR